VTSPQFSRASGDARLYWLDGASWSAAGGFGLVLFATSTGAPATLDLAASFTDYPGYYVSLAQCPATSAEPAFVDAVLDLGQRLGPARFLWLASSTPDPDWLRRALYLSQPAGAATGTVERPSVFEVGRYRVSVTAGQLVSPSSAGFAFDAGPLGGLPAFQLLTDDKAWPLTSAGASALSASGSTAGAFQLNLSIDATANPGGVGDYGLLDVGFRFGLPDPLDPQGMLLASLHYPLFEGAASAPVPMTMSFDPVGVLDPNRTMLRYPSTPATLPSHYTSQLGFGVSIAADASNPAAPAGLAFHRTPRSSTETAADDPLYLAPVGPYTLVIGAGAGTATPAARLTGGISGSEYFGFSSGTAVPLTFVPAQPAFAPGFPPTARQDGAGPPQNPRLRSGPEASGAPEASLAQLTGVATTAYASVGPPAGGQAWYFAQPEGGAFFQIRAAPSGRGPVGGQPAVLETGDPPDLIPYLELLELVSSTVTGSATSYPLVPYAGADGDLALMQALESQILSPLRRSALGAPPPGLLLAADVGDPPSQAITPQGLLADFVDNTWTSLTLSPAAPDTVLPRLAINSPSATFRSALQSNQLFLVAANPDEFQANADFNYWITDAVLGDLARLFGAEAVPASAITLLSEQGRTPQTSLADFTEMLDNLLTGPNAQYRDTVIKYSMYFELVVEGWRFRMSPSLWRDQLSNPPVLIIKYADGSLYDFVQNTDAWAWPAVATLDGSITATQILLNSILDSAIAEVGALGSSSNLAGFVTDIALNPSWTGVLMLNANVPFSSVPPELAGLAAGIQADQFRAHHVGISVTPVSIDEPNRMLAQDHSSIFGLIDYSELEDIAHIEGEFDFKVLLLQVLFVNTAIANFAGRIELFINRLFGELVTLYNSAHYNNLILNGSYQRQGSAGHYVFASTEVSKYGSSAAGQGSSADQVVLLATEIDQAQFVTASRDTAGDSIVHNRFLLQGKLRFAGLAGFDAFSFGPTLDRDGVQVADGYLVFSSASIDMDMPINAPEQRTFRFNLDEISFDPAASQARATSFFQRFPLQVAGLIQGVAGQPPQQLGYLPLATPLTQPSLTGPWFGLQFALDLGTLGALSSAPALTAVVLAAWSPAGVQHQVNIALKLPGVQSARSLLPIEGVLDLGFSSIDLTADGAVATPPDPAYVLRFRNFYLRFLGWKFPPGQNAMALFGNPDAASQSIATDRGALGWYAAYLQKDEE